jgi:hypothetical protein
MKNKRKILTGAVMVCSLLLVVSCRKTQVNGSEDTFKQETQSMSGDVTSKIGMNCTDQVIEAAPTISNAYLNTNVSYGTFSTSVFDLFIPTSASATNKVPLVIFVHGGGFTCGDKSDFYEVNNTTDNGDGNNPFEGDIQWYIDRGIAVASVNYRLKEDFPANQQVDSKRGYRITEAINDVKYCLQFIRYKSNTTPTATEPKYDFIDKQRIGMFGGSAGGAISISLAFANDGKLVSSSDPVLLESTRLKAVGHNNSQATYSPFHLNKIFTDESCTAVLSETLSVSSLNFMGLISSNADPILNDPPIYIRQTKTSITCPVIPGNDWVHHVFQARKLYNVANGQNKIIKDANNVAYSYIPKDNIGIPTGGNISSPPVYLMRDFMKLKL